MTVTLTVTKATPAITWAAPAAITYGTALTAAQLDASSGGVAGTFAYSPAAGAVLGAGSQTLSATFTPTDTADITTATGSVTLLVNQAVPVITWATPAPVAAGTALSATQLNAAASIPGTFTYTPTAGTMLTAGTQTLSTVFTPTDAVDYATATTSVSIVVTSFTLSGTAVTVARGATTGNTSTITISPHDGFTGNVTLTAAITSSPANAQDPPKLSFGSTSPVNLSGTTAGSATLTISTTAATSSSLVSPNRLGGRWYGGGAILACLLLVCIPRRRRWFAMLGLVAILFIVATNIAACGGGGGGGGGGSTGTTAGSYSITVTGIVGPTTTTTTVSLTVQ